MKIIINDSNAFIVESLRVALSVSGDGLIHTRNLCESSVYIKKSLYSILITELINEGEGIDSSVADLIYLTRVNAGLKIIVFTCISDASLLSLIKRLLPDAILIRKTEPVCVIREKYAARHSSFSHPARTDTRISKYHPAGSVTPREFGLMKWFVSGHNHVEIGRRLHLSPKTVSHYRRSLYRKLQCASEAEFVKKLLMLRLAPVS